MSPMTKPAGSFLESANRRSPQVCASPHQSKERGGHGSPGKGWIPEGGGLAMWARAGSEMQESRIVTDAQLIDEPTRQWLESIANIDVSNVAGVDPPDIALSFAMVQGNPLAACVNRALAELSESGELETIVETWLNPEMWRIDD